MKKQLLCIFIMSLLLISLTGCKNNENDKQKNISNNNEKESYLNYDLISEFKDGIAIATKTKNFETTRYVIDENFNVMFSYKGNEEFVGKYMKIADKGDSQKINIVNQNGDIVYSYDDKEFKKKVELVSNGLLIITEQTDTYNSSKTLTGIYDIESESYVLEPDEKYVNQIRTYGDNMLVLNDDKTVFFNTKTKKIVKFGNRILNEFKDGYSLEDKYSYEDLNTYMIVYDDLGNSKQIKALFDSFNIKEQENGMLFSSSLRIENKNSNEQITGTNNQLFDLNKGTVNDLSESFNLVNNAKFNSDGNALILFKNQGDETYYTVIDKDGKFLFEPEKRNNEASFGGESNEVPLIISDNTLYDGGYFIGLEDDYFKVIDKNNKLIVTSDNEYETFKSITNNSILVELEEPGKSKISYYKDLEGNKIGLKINGTIKEYN